MTQVVAEYELAIDLDGDEILAPAEEVTADVRTPDGGPRGSLLATRRGEDQTRRLAPPMAGDAGFSLINDGGAYDVANLPGGRVVRVRAAYDGTTYDLAQGLVDRPRNAPPGNAQQRVAVRVLGNLSRLAGKKVSTALYSSVRTDEAIASLLDAAGFQKNAQAYVTDLAPSGQWGLGEGSGDALDLSGHGNNGTVTLGSGARDATALDDAGDGSLTFDGAGASGTLVQMADVAGLQNIWDGGGAAWALVKPTGIGGTNAGTILEKNTGTWALRFLSSTGTACKVQFIINFSGATGTWITTDTVITFGHTYAVGLLYNSDATTNDPTLYLVDLGTGAVSTLTVGSGLTESVTPVGTRSSDAGSGLCLGNRAGRTRTLAGDLDEAAVWKAAQPTLAQLKGWASRCITARRRLDEGKTTLAWWWLDNEDAMQALATLKNTEGPGAALYEDGTGAVVFKNRHARILEDRSADVQTTFRTAAGGAEPLASLPLTFDPGLKDVVNECTVEVRTRAAQSLAQVWALGQTLTLAAGETRRFLARQQDGTPFTAAVAPSSGGGDYTVSAGSLASVPTLDRTSGASVTVTLTAGAGGATITGLRLRAQSVDVTNTTMVRSQVDAAESQAQYGVQTYPLPVRAEIAVSVAQDFADAVVGFWKDGRATAQVTVRANQSTERMTAALAREVGDRVRIIHESLDTQMYVEQIAHAVSAPSQHVTTFGLQEADVATYFQLDRSELDGVDVLGF